MPVSRWSASAARSGAVGFNVATLSRLVREKVRPARPDVCVSAKKFAQRTKNGPQSASCGAPGEVFRGRAAGGAVLGEFFRGPAVVGVAAGPLLAVLTLRCAATPYGWHGGQAAQATTHRANVRMKGHRPPPIGLTCAGCVHRGGAWRARRLPVPSISPGKRQRRDPEGSRLSLRAVAALSTPKSQCRKVSARNSAPEP